MTQQHLQHICVSIPVHLDQISMASGVSIAELMQSLTKLTSKDIWTFVSSEKSNDRYHRNHTMVTYESTLFADKKLSVKLFLHPHDNSVTTIKFGRGTEDKRIAQVTVS